jgi:hypothetical protein
MPSGGSNLYLRIRFGYDFVVSNNAKRRPTEKSSLLLKKNHPAPTAKSEPRYATREQMQKALKQVMEIHGEAFRRLAE